MLTAEGMGHVRLAIVDRTAAVSQPLHDYDHDIHAVFVGEIYNHRGLRESLKDRYGFTSHSDSAVLIPLYL
jgi:asparagine synthase (glutamine-hydrolysing)